eukprot:NODE_464_length_905_cov_1.420716_g456_i0.p1 GENE.NODE_464_length_905_cov_1.420716_g456_i0~~NODE_464_length_905_cov_1.420716_g456_i0.p1  ORF type:complete len:227 (+),score=42.81 NODE_464_length_905_cov_1.420716_g456_i0:162-842(+)
MLLFILLSPVFKLYWHFQMLGLTCQIVTKRPKWQEFSFFLFFFFQRPRILPSGRRDFSGLFFKIGRRVRGKKVCGPPGNHVGPRQSAGCFFPLSVKGRVQRGVFFRRGENRLNFEITPFVLIRKGSARPDGVNGPVVKAIGVKRFFVERGAPFFAGVRHILDIEGGKGLEYPVRLQRLNFFAFGSALKLRGLSPGGSFQGIAFPGFPFDRTKQSILSTSSAGMSNI